MKKLIFTSFFLLASIYATAQTWNIGEPNLADVKATLSNDTLYVRGTGDTQDYLGSGGILYVRPWATADYAASIEHIAVESGITSLGSYIFSSLPNLVSVSLPNTLTKIEMFAFKECTSLPVIVIPEGVQTLGAGVFWMCFGLSSVTIPRSCDTFLSGTGVFYSCNSLKTIYNHNPRPQTVDDIYTFSNTYGIKLYVPCGSLEIYKSDETWKNMQIEENCPKAGISNVKADYSCPGQVTVNYDLGTTDTTDVTLHYSPDGGNTWLLAKTVTGDLTAQSSGTGKTIVWDNRADNVKWGRFRLKVEVPKVSEPECVMINGVCWATRNVDAPGTFADKPEDAGMFYQWNSKVGWSSTDPMVSTNGSAWDWGWDGNGAATWETTNNVCPAGYRVPTVAELQSLVDAGGQVKTINSVKGQEFGSGANTIFLPATGSRHIGGTLVDKNEYGSYWSNTSDDSGGFWGIRELYFQTDNNFSSVANLFDIATAFPLRCVKE